MKPSEVRKLSSDLSRTHPSELTAKATRLYERFRDEIQCVKTAGLTNRNTGELFCKNCYNTGRIVRTSLQYIATHELAIDKRVAPRSCNRCASPVKMINHVLRCTKCVSELNNLCSLRRD